MWTSGFKWVKLEMYDAEASYICAGEMMGSTWKVINTQVPVTLTVAPALRKRNTDIKGKS